MVRASPGGTARTPTAAAAAAAAGLERQALTHQGLQMAGPASCRVLTAFGRGEAAAVAVDRSVGHRAAQRQIAEAGTVLTVAMEGLR